jgi:hypothetical protein
MAKSKHGADAEQQTANREARMIGPLAPATLSGRGCTLDANLPHMTTGLARPALAAGTRSRTVGGLSAAMLCVVELHSFTLIAAER